jgi:hypothetical protein
MACPRGYGPNESLGASTYSARPNRAAHSFVAMPVRWFALVRQLGSLAESVVPVIKDVIIHEIARIGETRRTSPRS